MKNSDIVAKYSDAKEIWLLNRKKQLTGKERIFDALTSLFSPLPGIVEEADSFADMGGYILVVKPDTQLLVRIEKDKVEEQDVTGQCDGKKFVVGQNRFLKVRKIYG